jgi:hypothetical protein
MNEEKPIPEPGTVVTGSGILKVYYTVEELFNTKFANHSPQFKKGFEKCLLLFHIGLKRRTDYNLAIKNVELEKEVKELKKVVKRKYEKLRDMEHDMQNISMISGIPTEDFRIVLIETDLGNFSIVVNMDQNTLNACLVNFALRYTFKTVDEGKSKLLKYINNKNDYGFRAFKDENVAIKEGVKLQ